MTEVVNTQAAGNQGKIDIVQLDDGRLLYVWADAAYSDIGTSFIYGRIQNADGSFAGDQFQIGTLPVDGFDGFDVNHLTVEKMQAGVVAVGYVDGSVVFDTVPRLTLLDTTKDQTDPDFVIAADVQIDPNTLLDANGSASDYEGPPIMQALSDGRLMVVWTNNAASDGLLNQTLSGRIFNADGTPSTDEFSIANLPVDGSDFSIKNVDITELADGTVVVGYVDDANTAANGGLDSDPRLTFIDPSLAPTDPDFIKAIDVAAEETQETGYDSAPKLHALDDGRLLAVWLKDGVQGNGLDGELEARFFNSDGTPASGEFTISSKNIELYGGYDEESVQITTLGNGNIALTYLEDNDAGLQASQPFTTIIDPTQAVGSPEFYVAQDVPVVDPSATYIVGDANGYTTVAKIATISPDAYVAVWGHGNALGFDTDVPLYYRVFDNDGNPLSGAEPLQDPGDGSQFYLNSANGIDGDMFEITTNNFGEFAVAYVGSSSPVSADGSGTTILTTGPIDPPALDPELSPNGIVEGGTLTCPVDPDDAPEVVNNIDQVGYQSPPKLVDMADGRTLFVWTEDGLSDIGTSTLNGRFMLADGTWEGDQFDIPSSAVEGFDGFGMDHMTVKELAGGNIVIGFLDGSQGGFDASPLATIIDPTLSPGAPGFIVAQDVELQQNDTTVFESPPVLQELDDGRFMAFWVKNGLNDDTTMHVQGRIFNADGTAASDEFRVGNSSIDGTEGWNADTLTAVQLAGGNVVVGFIEQAGATFDASPIATILDPTFAPADGGFVVAEDIEVIETDTTLYESPPKFLALDDGRFLATWVDDGLGDSGTEQLSGRLFNPDGTPATGDFDIGLQSIDGYDGFDLDTWQIAPLGDGNIAITYLTNNSETFTAAQPQIVVINPNLDPSDPGFYVETGQPVVEDSPTTRYEFGDASSYTTPAKIIAVNAEQFVAVWGHGSYDWDTPLYYRVFDNDGTPQSGAELLSTTDIGTWIDGANGFGWDSIDLISDGDGQFLIGYVGSDYLSKDNNGTSVLTSAWVRVADPTTPVCGDDDVMVPGYADGGGDLIDGADGLDDLIAPGGGNDIVDAGDGSDTIFLGDGAGVDTISGGEGTNGGGDFDTLDGSAVNGDVVVDFTGPEAGTFANGPNIATFSDIEKVITGTGDDTVDAAGLAGPLDVETGLGDDNITGSDGNDTIDAGEGSDTVNGGAGDDQIDLGGQDGNPDTVIFADGDGNDVIDGFDAPIDDGLGGLLGVDQLDVSGLTDISGDPIDTNDVTVSDDGSGNATLSFPNGESITLTGVDPADVDAAFLEAIGIPAAPLPDGVVDGAEDGEVMSVGYTDPQGDAITEGPDQIEGNGGDDTISAGGGDDIVNAGDGNDSVDGGDGNDQISGGLGSDTLAGGLGADTLDGGEGDDTITAGAGDTVIGGGGDDVFTFDPTLTEGPGTITVTGGETGEDLTDPTNGGDGDVLDLSGLDNVVVTPDGGDPASESGTATYTDANGDTITINYSEIESVIVPCLTSGTHVRTEHGMVRVEDLCVGDRVETMDSGLQEIRWIGSRTVPGKGHLAPVVITAGTFGNTKTLRVSQQHRMLVHDWRADLLSGYNEVLVAAKHLVDHDSIYIQEVEEVQYFHILFDKHEVIYAENAATESFHPGAVGLSGLADPQLAELLELFPELEVSSSAYGPLARPTLKAYEAAALLNDW